MSINPISGNTPVTGPTTPQNQKPADNTPAQKPDTVQLSETARSILSGTDKDGDGDGK